MQILNQVMAFWAGALMIALIFLMGAWYLKREEPEIGDAEDEEPVDVQAVEVLHEIYREWQRATKKHAGPHSAHEALAILQEEAFELQEAVYSNSDKNPRRMEEIRAEVIQVGAMALRFIIDVTDKPVKELQ